jgi:hypothetical protein
VLAGSARDDVLENRFDAGSAQDGLELAA